MKCAMAVRENERRYSVDREETPKAVADPNDRTCLTSVRLIKIAARVVEGAARIRVYLPTACPDRDVVSKVRIISSGMVEFVGPSVDDGMSVELVHGRHDTFLEFLF